MSILSQLQVRFDAALIPLVADAAEHARLVDMVRPARIAKFGDYQAKWRCRWASNSASRRATWPRTIVARLDVADLCQPPEIAGPGLYQSARCKRRLVGRSD